MTYRVVAPLVLAQDQEGHTHHFYAGEVIPWLSDGQAAHFLESGLVVDVASPADTADPLQEPGDGKPAANATKPLLVAWLVSNAVKDDGSDYTDGELGTLNKAALWELINAVED